MILEIDLSIQAPSVIEKLKELFPQKFKELFPEEEEIDFISGNTIWPGSDQDETAIFYKNKALIKRSSKNSFSLSPGFTWTIQDGNLIAGKP